MRCCCTDIHHCLQPLTARSYVALSNSWSEYAAGLVEAAIIERICVDNTQAALASIMHDY